MAAVALSPPPPPPADRLRPLRTIILQLFATLQQLGLVEGLPPNAALAVPPPPDTPLPEADAWALAAADAAVWAANGAAIPRTGASGEGGGGGAVAAPA